MSIETEWENLVAWFEALFHHAHAGTLPPAPVAGGPPVSVPPINPVVITPPAPPLPLPPVVPVVPVVTAPALPLLPTEPADPTCDVTDIDANGLGVSAKVDAAVAIALQQQPSWKGYPKRICYVGMFGKIADAQTLKIARQQVWDAGNYPSIGGGFSEHPDEVGEAQSYDANGAHTGAVAYAYSFGRNHTTIEQVLAQIGANFARFSPVDPNAPNPFVPH